MRRHPSSWIGTLTKLGLRRRRSPRRRRIPSRLARLERLEARELLAVTVNTLLDDNVAGNGLTSLREALAAVTPQNNQIVFDAAATGGVLRLTHGELTIGASLQIVGPGAASLTVDAGGAARALNITSSSATVAISGLTVTGGGGVQQGGGILNAGNLTLDGVAIAGNASTVSGGGVHSTGTLRLWDSTIDGNRSVAGSGVAVVLSGGVLEIADSTISNNRRSDLVGDTDGGGLRVTGSSGTATIKNSTFAGNEAKFAGGIRVVDSGVALSIVNSTIVGNVGGDGGGMQTVNSGTTVTVHNTIVAANQTLAGAPSDVGGALNSASSNNIFGAGAGTTDLTGGALRNQIGSPASPLNARVAPLGRYGGAVKTMPPLPGSPAIDRGKDSHATGLSFDQRGVDRTVDDQSVSHATGEAIDIGAVELGNQVVATADFNGDGRDDRLYFSPTARAFTVAEGAANLQGWSPSFWGAVTSGPLSTANWAEFVAGDFNGDGRDDVMLRNSANDAWALAVSDGAAFYVHDLGITGAWAQKFVGDFDGDGSQQLLVRSSSSSPWQYIKYHDVHGARLINTGLVSAGNPAFTVIHVGDANRDGRDDLITQTGAGQPWWVSISGINPNGTGAMGGVTDWGTWFDDAFEGGALNADKPLKRLLEEFAWVYNNVELELYPGFMKGPDATAETRAGNNFDQAGLLEKRLQALPFVGADNVQIATGLVRVTSDHIEELGTWLGVEGFNATYLAIINSLDGNLVPRDANGGNSLITGLPAVALEFSHAWVRAKAPTATGLNWVDLDPSWKFKDLREGISLSPTVNLAGGDHPSLGLFDEFDYLTLDPHTDKRLPVEFFEDQLMEWLAANQPGTSLADVLYDGPIITKAFETVPAGLGAAMTIVAPASVATHESFDAIAANSAAASQLTHRALVSLERETSPGSDVWTSEWSTASNPTGKYEIVVPRDALKTFQVTYAATQGAQTNPQSIAPDASSQYWSRLVVDGALADVAGGPVDYASQSALASVQKVRLTVEHLGPTTVAQTSWNATNQVVEFAGQVVAIGLDANQHSHKSMAALQRDVLSAVGANATEASLLQSIDDLASYAIANYWYHDNLDRKSILRLTRSIGASFRVGSGVVTADAKLVLDAEPEGANDVLIEYLPFGIAPRDIGVDIRVLKDYFLMAHNGVDHAEARELFGHNGSALEHLVFESVIGGEGMSTMKGLQRAAQRNLGLTANPSNAEPAVSTPGNPATGLDSIVVLKSTWTGSTRQVAHVANWTADGISTAEAQTNISQSYLTDATTGKLRLHNGFSDLGETVWDYLKNSPESDGEILVLAPAARSNLGRWEGNSYVNSAGGWTGAAYYVSNAAFFIQRDGGQPSSGGASGNFFEPPNVPLGSFPNFASAGDPVNVANGNMFRDETDVAFANIGVPLSFSRHYDAQSKDDFGMGTGWIFSFGDLLYKESPSALDVTWLASSGLRREFAWNGSANTHNVPAELRGQVRFTNSAGVESETVPSGGWTEFRYKDADGTEYHFQAVGNVSISGKTVVGRLAKILDRNGDGVVVEYDAGPTRNIKWVRDVHSTEATPARRLEFDYTANSNGGVVSQIRKFDGGGATPTWNYSYIDVPGSSAPSPKRLRTATAPSVSIADANYAEVARSPVTEYEYYLESDAHAAFAKGLIKRITEPDGAWHAYEYFYNGRTFRVTQGGPASGVADLSGFTGVGNLSIPNNYSAGPATIGGTFDSRRNGAGEATAYLADTSLDVPGGVLTATTAGGFSASGQLRFDANSGGASVDPYFAFGFFDKDNLAAPLFGIAVGGTSATSLLFVPVAGGSITTSGTVVNEGAYTFELDVNNAASGAGKVRFRLISPSSAVVMSESADIPGGATLEADSFGFEQPLAPTDSDATFTMLVSELRYTGETLVAAGAGPTTGAGDVQTFNYNLLRNLTEFADERGNVETYIHQDNGLLVEQIHADRTRLRYTWGAIDSPQEFLMTSTTDERGAIETFTYYGGADPAFKHGHLKTATAKHFAGQAGLVTAYEYVQPKASGAGAQPHIVSPSSVVVDPDASGYTGLKLTTTFTYYPSDQDAYGRLWKTTDAENFVTELTYYPTNDATAHRRGLLKSEARVGGNRQVVVDYDAAGNLVSRTTWENGSPLPAATYAYDSNGNMVREVDATGVSREHVFDALGRLRETGFGDSNPDVNPLDAFTTKFKHDARGRVRESIDPLGRVTRFEYDGRGRLVQRINPDGTTLVHEYDAFGNCIAVSDELGRVTRYAYDSRNRRIETIYADGVIERVQYDGVGNVVGSLDALGNIAVMEYDAAGRLLEATLPDPDGAGSLASPVTTYKYDNVGRLVATVDPELNVTQLKHDKLGRVIETRVLRKADVPSNIREPNVGVPATTQAVALSTVDFDLHGDAVRTTAYDTLHIASIPGDPRSLITTQNIDDNVVQVAETTYDALHRLIEQEDAVGTAAIDYDDAGRIESTTDELGRTTEYDYDSFGRLVQTVLADPDGANVDGGVDLQSPVTTYAYDAVGNRTAVTDPRGFTTRFEYDVYNRPFAVVDALDGRTRSLYDAAGQVVAAIDALGRATYTLYDERGRAKLQRSADPDGTGPAIAPTTRLEHDAAGRLVERIDPLGYSTEYAYDALGRLTVERRVVSLALDDGDGEFGPVGGDDIPTKSIDPASYGGDYTTFTPMAGTHTAEAQAVFAGLPAGTYRLAVTWQSAAGLGTAVQVRVAVDGGALQSPGGVAYSYNPGVAADDLVRHDEGVARGWEEAPPVTISGSGLHQLRVVLSPQLDTPLRADAVRLERVVESTFSYDANGNLLSETDPLGRQSLYRYDELGRLVRTWSPDPDGAGSLGSLTAQTAYDGYSNVVKTINGFSALPTTGTPNPTISQARETVLEYDQRNRLVEEIVDAGSGGLALATEYAYNEVDLLIETVELPGRPLQRRTTYKYDALDRLTRETVNSDGNDSVTTLTELVTVSHYDAAGNVERVEANPGADPRQIATVYQYDALGRVVRQTDVGLVDGGVTESRISRLVYDAVGNVVAEIDQLGRATRHEYDRLDRLAKSIDPDPDGAGAQASHFTEFAYDPAGHLTLASNGGVEIDRFFYDAQGRRVRALDGRGEQTRWRYDDAGNLAAFVDAVGNVTSYVYDALDRVVTETNASGSRTRVYDGRGRLVRETDRLGRVRTFEYDRLDRLFAERWYANAAAADAGTESDVLNWNYDELGRLDAARHDFLGADPGVDHRTIRRLEYDGLDRTTLETNRKDGWGTGGVDAPEVRTTTAFSYSGVYLIETREQSIAGQNAARTLRNENAFGETRFLSDRAIAGGILAFNTADGSFNYNAAGALIAAHRKTDWNAALGDFNNYVRTEYAYDGAGRIAGLAHKHRTHNGASWPSYANSVALGYQYDAAGRISQVATDWNTALTGLTTRSDATDALAYDNAGQLAGVDSSLSGGDSSYSYNANGNRSSATEPVGGSDSYAIGGQNRVTADSQFTYVYDNEGNLTERRVTSGNVLNQRLSWDHRNRLSKVENFNAGGQLVETIDYRYDAAGGLVRRSETPSGGSASVEHYVRDALGRRAMTVQTDGDVLRRTTYGPAGDVLFDQVFDGTGNPATQSPTALLLPLGDHQHSTRVVLGHAGIGGAADRGAHVLRQSIDYAPFGRLTALRDAAGALVVDGAGQPDLDALDTAFAHHGSLLDPDTGLVLKGARWHSPDLGRFVSTDPIEEGGNWYLLAGNDPVNFADPSGLRQAGHPLAGGIAGGGAPSASSIPAGALSFTSTATSIGPQPYSAGGGFNPASYSTGGFTTTAPSIAPQSVFAATPAFNFSNMGIGGPPQSFNVPTPQINFNNDFGSFLSGGGPGPGSLQSPAPWWPTTDVTSNSSLPSAPILPFGSFSDSDSVGNGIAVWETTPEQLAILNFIKQEAERQWQAVQEMELIKIAQSQARRGNLVGEAQTIANVGTSVGPQADIRDAYEIATGRDAINDAPLTGWGYGLTVVGAVLPGVAGSLLRRLFAAADTGAAVGQAAAKQAQGAAAVSAPSRTAVRAYEVGTADVLQSRSVVGDKISIHHAGQAHAMKQLIPGYNRTTAPSIAIPTSEHLQIPNVRGQVNVVPRQVLANDIWNLKKYTTAPNSSLQELIQLNKQMYPGAFGK